MKKTFKQFLYEMTIKTGKKDKFDPDNNENKYGIDKPSNWRMIIEGEDSPLSYKLGKWPDKLGLYNPWTIFHIDPDKQALAEGGKAIKSASRINQLNVKATIDSLIKELLPLLGLQKNDVSLLGSAGKKDPNKNGSQEGSSGDIDLGISLKSLVKANKLNQDEAFDFVKDKCKQFKELNSFAGFNIVSIAYPIENEDGKQANQFCQVDLMLVDDLKLAKWTYHAPSFSESKYKALMPKELYFAIARVAKTEVKKSMEENGKEVPAEWNRLFFDLNNGLMSGTQSRIGKKGQLNKSVKTTSKMRISTDPDYITKELFGEKFRPEDVMTWENAWKAIMSKDFKHKAKLGEILLLAKKGIESKGQKVPKELEDELRKHLAAPIKK